MGREDGIGDIMSDREFTGDGGPDQDEVARLLAEMDAEDEEESGDGDREDRFAWDEEQILVTKKMPVDPQPE